LEKGVKILGTNATLFCEEDKINFGEFQDDNDY